MHGNIDADIIIMGSSRAWVHIDPIMLDSILHISSYNIGMDGSTINRQIHKYNLFRRFNRKPKVIIQNIDYSSMGHGTGFKKEQFYPYFWNMEMRKEMLEYEPVTFWEKYVPFHRYRETEKNYFTMGPQTLTKGYKGQEKTWDGTNYKAVDSISFTVNDTTESMFINYLAKAKSEEIKVIFVYTPIYLGATNKMTNLDAMYAYYRNISEKYNIPILDYTYMNICNDTTYFYNALHLNKKGAEIFSDSLAHDLKKVINY
jgi:hypothetical protein